MITAVFRMSVLALLLSGCGYHEQPWRWTPPYPDRTVPPQLERPAVVHCTDEIGHVVGNLPYIYSGDCCCTPTLEVLRAYQKLGQFRGWTVDALRAAYQRRGITTGDDHDQCNNLCENGPHLVKGGRCMVAPSPGTLNHEEVLSGQFSPTPWDRKQVDRFGGPVTPDPIPTAVEVDAPRPGRDEHDI